MNKLAMFALAGMLGLSLSAQAGTTTFRGVSVDYGNASAGWAGDELVLTYGNVGEDSLKLGGAVKADVLLVGGGGSGSSGGSSSNKQGYGGGGGEVVARSGVTLSGESPISVGSGGAAVKATSKFSRTSGISGGKTTIGGALGLEAAGGAAGGSDVSGQGTESDISGASVTYGADGGSRTSSSASVDGAANTGNGGSGGYAGATSGAGGSGVVIVRLKAVYASVTLADMTLGQGEEAASFSEKAAGAPVDIFFSEVSEVGFSPEGVAQATRTKDGRLTLVGAGPGETTVTIAKETDTVIYTAKVTVRAAIKLNDLTIQRNETTAALVREDTGELIDLNYDDAKALKSSVPEIADFVRLPDGKIGVAGRLTGTVDMTIIAEGQSYRFTVMVEKLLSGLYKAGAYEVAVSNASDISYVDGDLVLIYRDVDVNIKKSFELPKATTGRLLAVGGGGAGGQDQKQGYNANYGLPGGGGAGGLVINDTQTFEAKTYNVSVGAGGAAVVRTQTTSGDTKTWVPAAYGPGNNGEDSTVKQGATAIVTAKGGGGGGRRSVGNAGGSGGGGSANYSSRKVQSRSGGAGESGQGNAGGTGEYAKYGAGGGGAGGPGSSTTKISGSSDPTTVDVNVSFAGGPGVVCDITGEMLEYARGGAGGVPRVCAYYYYKGGQIYYTNTEPTDQQKSGFDNGKYFWSEASDGKPGRDGFGDGGGGSGHYNDNPTFAGRGGNGAVIVRIPPYKTTVEDALKGAFADQPVTVSGDAVTLTGDVTGPIAIPDNLGAVTINLNGHAIVGANGTEGDDITPGGNGQAALAVVAHAYASEANATTEISVTGAGSLKGGDGGTGYPGGAGAPALSADGFSVSVAAGISVSAGKPGESLVQHPHKWAYAVEDGKIIAYCMADDGEPCSYRDHSRGPFVAISAADAAYTAMRYDELTTVNGITPVTGIVVAPEMYVGRDGTDYPESATPPTEQGAYTVKMKLDDMTISSDFIITEPKPSQGSVYEAWKTAERRGHDVRIYLSATFAGGKAINDGDVLFLGSRCSAHSMAEGTVESSVNALARYANVRWYAYGSDDPEKNLVNQLTEKGKTVKDGTVTIVGRNHFVHKEMMDDLYAELVEKKNIPGDYDLILLEFDGDLLGRDGASPYELVYSLPAGWTDEKAARLRAAMSRYYAENRVVWIVPDVNQEKSDAGYTGEYPWTSNPEFIWQRAFLNATETEGYRCPLQKNYEDTDSLVAYLQDTLVGHLFSNVIIKDKLADGLSATKVTPQMRGANGIWRDFGGGPTDYSISEPRSGTTVTAKVKQPNDKDVTVTFDMREEQMWACAHDQVIGDDFRVVIDAALDGFFDDVADGEEKATNDGDATFTFTDPNLDEDEDDYEIEIMVDSPTIRNEKLTPDYAAEDVIKIYDGKGTNIVVKPISPEPGEAVVRYSLDEHGTYTDNLALTNVCDKTKVWFEITDKSGDFTTVTNFACVTILPLPPEPPQEESMGVAVSAVEKFYDGLGTNVACVVTNAAGEVITDATIFLREKGMSIWIPAADFAQYVGATNATVEVRAEKTGFTFATAEATILVKPRPVTLVAGSASKTYDGAPLACDTFTVKEDAATPGYGFIGDDGVASVTMTPESTITNPGSKPNVIATETAKEGTDLERNYVVSTEPGSLEVTAASMGVAAFPAAKFYDGLPTNITWAVTNATGAVITDATISFREKGTDAWVPAADFAQYVDATNATVEVRAEKKGFFDAFGEATVEIKKATLTVTADDKEIVYGSDVPGADFYTFEYDGFVNGESADVLETKPAFGSGYTATTPTGDVAIEKATDGVAENYDFEYVPGTLTVTKSKQTGVKSDSYSGTYDGDGHTIAVDPDGGTVTYLVGGDWVADAPLYTNRVEATNVVFRVEKEGYETFEGTNTVTVSAKAVTLESGSRTFPYDGKPHAYTNLAATGFVEGEGLSSTSDWATVTSVAEGEVDNSFAYTLAEGTLAENYVITVTTGKISVAAAPVVPKNPASPAENPDDEPDENEGVTLWAENVVKMYDGVGTNVLPQVYNAVDGNGFAYEYSTNGTDWTDSLAFTNVVDAQKVYFRTVPQGDVPNYLPTNGYAYVTITKATLTVTADDKEIVYGSGTPGADFYTFKYDGFVNGETAEALTTEPTFGSAYTVATAPGATEIEKVTDGVAKNYDFEYIPGTLTVTAAPMGVAAFPAAKVYDGAPTNITWVVTNATGAVIADAVISLREKGTETWIPAAKFGAYVDVTAKTVEVKAEKAGYSGAAAEATVTITPKAVTITSGTKTDFVYDGQAHAFEKIEADGFAEGEGVASGSGWATVTDISQGEVSNAFEYTLKDNTDAGNYAITVEKGKIAVVPAPVNPKEPADDNPEENPDDEPTDTDGPTLWAQNVVKVYDGLPTNILAGVYNAVDGNEFAYEYSIDEGEEKTWSETLSFTNATDGAQKVFFRAVPQGDAPNYKGAECYAYVTITKRPVEITFTAADKIYDGNTNATCTATNFVGIADGEGLGLDITSMTFSFDTPEVGIGKTVTATGYEESCVRPIGETKVSNYAIAFVETTKAAITMREEEVRRDPSVVVPREAEEALKASDEKIKAALEELVKDDPKVDDEPYIKYQLTVTPAGSLSEKTRTTPAEAKGCAECQIELVEKSIGKKVDKAEFIDIVLERTYDKTEAEETAKGNYNKDNWEPIDKAEEHGNKLLEVTIPLEVPSGMRLVAVTRSCNEKNEMLGPRNPNDPDAEGFVYDPATKTITLYARDFCVFGFMMRRSTPMLSGRMRWKYQQADNSFWCALDVACTNGDQTAIQNLCYIYEDRADCYLRDPSPMSTRKLSDTSYVTYGGKRFGKVVLADVATALRGKPLNTKIRYGVSDATLASSRDRVSSAAEMRTALYKRNRIALVKEETAAIEASLGYLTWQETGSDAIFWCALAKGLEPLPVDALSGTQPPLSLAMANKAKAFGLPPLTTDSDPSLVLDAFSIADGVVHGRVATLNGKGRGVPGSNARVAILGAANLTGGFAEIARPGLGADGSFSFKAPGDIRFFRVRLTYEDVIK